MWHTSSKCHQLEWIAIPLIHIMHKHMKAWQTQNLQIFDKIVQVQIALDYCKLTLDLILTMLSRNLTIFIQRIHSHSWQKVQRRPRYTCVCVCVCVYIFIIIKKILIFYETSFIKKYTNWRYEYNSPLNDNKIRKKQLSIVSTLEW